MGPTWGWILRDRRKAELYVLQVPGSIVIDAAAYPCTIYDKSKTGARLIKFGDIKLPPQFLMQGPSAAQPCWLIWQTDKEAGVSFSKPD